MTKQKQIKNSNNLITWGGDDPFTHTLVVGPTRCGKTATILKPIIFSILLAKKKGQKVGLTIIEPKGDVARMVKEMSEEMGLNDQLVYIDPLYPNETDKINVMRGDKNDVAEATVAVLKSLFGKQDAFFATVQELSSRKVTLLLKELYENDMDIMDVLANLRDADLLKQNVETHRQRFGNTELVTFFDNELLGSGQLAEKYRQFIVGLRSQLENITSNDYLRAIVTGKSDIDLDEHLREGNILAVNSALGKLGKSGDAFGMFIAMHMQLASFRRPGTERTRVPHYLIIDEYSRYINPDVERFLSIAAEYRVGLIAAIQSLSQLEVEAGTISGRAMKNAILTSMRNKIVFGGLEYADAEEVTKMMGSNMMMERTRTFDGGILQNILPKAYREEEVEKERFHSTMLMDGLPRFHCICKLLMNGTPQEPIVAVGQFVPDDWKEKMIKESEENSILNQKRPPFYKWSERALYDVKMFDFLENEKRVLEAKKKLAEEDPFQLKPITPVEKEVSSVVIPVVPTIMKEKVAEEKDKPVPVKKDLPVEVTLPAEEIIFSIGKRNASPQPVEVEETNEKIVETPAVLEIVENKKIEKEIPTQTNVQSEKIEKEKVIQPKINNTPKKPVETVSATGQLKPDVVDFYPPPSGDFGKTNTSDSANLNNDTSSKDNDIFDDSDSGFW